VLALTEQSEITSTEEVWRATRVAVAVDRRAAAAAVTRDLTMVSVARKKPDEMGAGYAVSERSATYARIRRVEPLWHLGSSSEAEELQRLNQPSRRCPLSILRRWQGEGVHRMVRRGSRSERVAARWGRAQWQDTLRDRKA